MSLTQKTALITGATRGIGLQIAKSFASQGANTILVGRDPDRVAKVQQNFCDLYGSQAHKSLVMDVSNKDQIDLVFKELLKGQQIDCLVNAAGISRDGLLIQMKEQDLLDTINTNLLGTMRVTQHVAKAMLRKRKGGCIINVASVIGMHGNIGQSSYSASKAGIIGFTKSLAKELGPYNIRVNAIAPGFIDTDMTSDISEEKRQKILESIPLKRFGHVEDVSLAALFIAQSNYFHGQVLTLDGGLVL
ncbi:3-oxoacyl-reductase [Blakeslea trispora]|nr:3-oxoacyl-reductase [Blakeslea trispora]